MGRERRRRHLTERDHGYGDRLSRLNVGGGNDHRYLLASQSAVREDDPESEHGYEREQGHPYTEQE